MILFPGKTVYITALLAYILLLQSCIHDDFGEPEATEVPVGEVITVSELRSMYEGSSVYFDHDVSVYATVTMDDKNGNIYRSAFVEDGSAAINLRMMAPGGIYEGDSVRIYLKGTTLDTYQGMMQLDNVNADKNIIKLATLKAVEPLTAGIGQLDYNLHQARLVRLENVQFISSDVGQPLADSENLQTINRTLEDCSGNTLIVRTSGYSNFADIPVPEGNGSVVGVIAQYQQDLQLYIRNMGEVSLEGQRCGTK